MAKTRSRALDYLAYLAVRTLACLIQAVPMETGYRVARGLAWLVWKVDKRHRRVAEENLRHAFGDRLTEARRKAMVLDVYRHFLAVVIEMMWIPRRMSFRNWKRTVTIEGSSRGLQQFLGERPVIVVTGHFGNWEMAGFLFAALGAKTHAIARTLDNPYLNDFLLRFREYTGQTILSKNGDFDRIQQVLRDRGILVSLADQAAGPRGLFVNFFGRPASTHKAIALLAMEHDAPVVVGWGWRSGPGFEYRIGVSEPIDPRSFPDNQAGILDFTQRFTTVLEEAILKAPEQYLWLHHRWKHEPPVKKKRERAATPAMANPSPETATSTAASALAPSEETQLRPAA
jgi:KDO2-lipid IV(A) lauroyltransferase